MLARQGVALGAFGAGGAGMRHVAKLNNLEVYPMMNRTGLAGRLGLRPCESQRGRKRGSTRCQMQKLTARKFHGFPPLG
jgi:hypothetical protein